MQVWVTKYALSKGIQLEDVEPCTFDSRCVKTVGMYSVFYGAGEWFTEKSDAIANAEERRITKLKSLDKQVKKVSSMKFE